MPQIHLKYGKTAIPFSYNAERFEVLRPPDEPPALSDVDIGERLDSPIASARLEEIVNAGETVLFVVPDATRNAAAGQILNLIVRRMISNGTVPHEMAVIFATGIHRRVTEEEKHAILTPFIAQRLKTLDHDASNPLKNFRVGETSGGIPVELNWSLTEFDHVVLIGGVTFHYFAGFTGGRKLICPGLASVKTISATHMLAFDCEKRDRRDGVGTGLLDGNPVHEAFVEAASLVKVSFAVNTIVNDAGGAVDLYCGDWTKAHLVACGVFAERHSVEIKEKRDLVIVSCGGYPYDINLIQAHKALEAASRACNDGGTIILLAECGDGLGRDDFLDWFDAANSDALAQRLCEDYQVNGQTAWSLLRKSERFELFIQTCIGNTDCTKMRMRRGEVSEVARSQRYHEMNGYLIEMGAKISFRSPK